MSSILKALKKLENENAARNHDPLKIDSEILRGDSSDRVSPIKIILLAVFLFVCGSSATYVYMKQGQGAPHAPAKTLNPPVPALPKPLPSSLAPAKIPVERIEPETIVAAMPEPDIKQNRSASQKAEATHVSTRPLSASPIRVQQAHLNKIQRPQRIVEKKQMQPSISGKKTAGDSHTAVTALQIPALKVNGIAFQNGSDSVAVVNGVPVSEGSSIEGAKVVEIQRDRILFNYGGEKFNVQLGKSNH